MTHCNDKDFAYIKIVLISIKNVGSRKRNSNQMAHEN